MDGTIRLMRASPSMRPLLVASLLVLASSASAAAQPRRESLMPQRETLMNAGGTQQLEIDCLPIRNSPDVECTFTTTSLFVSQSERPSSQERTALEEMIVGLVREVRSRQPVSAQADEARARLEQWCRVATPDPGLGAHR